MMPRYASLSDIDVVFAVWGRLCLITYKLELTCHGSCLCLHKVLIISSQIVPLVSFLIWKLRSYENVLLIKTSAVNWWWKIQLWNCSDDENFSHEIVLMMKNTAMKLFWWWKIQLWYCSDDEKFSCSLMMKFQLQPIIMKVSAITWWCKIQLRIYLDEKNFSYETVLLMKAALLHMAVFTHEFKCWSPNLT